MQACKFSNLWYCISYTPILKQNPNHNPESNISLLAGLHDHGHNPHYEDCNHGRSPFLAKKLSEKIDSNL